MIGGKIAFLNNSNNSGVQMSYMIVYMEKVA